MSSVNIAVFLWQSGYDLFLSPAWLPCSEPLLQFWVAGMRAVVLLSLLILGETHSSSGAFLHLPAPEASLSRHSKLLDPGAGFAHALRALHLTWELTPCLFFHLDQPFPHDTKIIHLLTELLTKHSYEGFYQNRQHPERKNRHLRWVVCIQSVIFWREVNFLQLSKCLPDSSSLLWNNMHLSYYLCCRNVYTQLTCANTSRNK